MTEQDKRKTFIQRIANEIVEFWEATEDEDIREIWDDIYSEIERKIGV